MEELRGGRPPVELVGRPESSCFTNCLRTVGELFGAVAPRCGWRLATISIVAVGTIRIALDGGNLVGDAADRHGTENGLRGDHGHVPRADFWPGTISGLLMPEINYIC